MFVYRYLSVQDGQAKTANFPCNLYLEDKHQLRDTENVTKQQKEVLGIILKVVLIYMHKYHYNWEKKESDLYLVSGSL
jgi:hypothetical protein